MSSLICKRTIHNRFIRKIIWWHNVPTRMFKGKPYSQGNIKFTTKLYSDLMVEAVAEGTQGSAPRVKKKCFNLICNIITVLKYRKYRNFINKAHKVFHVRILHSSHIFLSTYVFHMTGFVLKTIFKCLQHVILRAH